MSPIQTSHHHSSKCFHTNCWSNITCSGHLDRLVCPRWHRGCDRLVCPWLHRECMAEVFPKPILPHSSMDIVYYIPFQDTGKKKKKSVLHLSWVSAGCPREPGCHPEWVQEMPQKCHLKVFQEIQVVFITTKDSHSGFLVCDTEKLAKDVWQLLANSFKMTKLLK